MSSDSSEGMSQELNKIWDVAVIGAGSAGYAAARTAAALGASVVIIEGGKEIGGLCILRGCMPTKTLLESSQRLHDITRASEFGIRVRGVEPVLKKIHHRRKRLIEEFAAYRREQLTTSEKFTFLRGRASFCSEDCLELHTTGSSGQPNYVRFKKAIIATGSRVVPENVPGLRETGFLTSDEAIELSQIPPRLAVLGGGPVAVEFAQHFSRLGSRVTILLRSEHILRGTDPDIADALTRAFQSEKIRIIPECQINAIQPSRGTKLIHFTQGGKTHRLETDEILYAWGRRPATDGLNCHKARVSLTSGGAVRVTKDMRTTNKNIYAVGDVNGIFEVVHIAIQQGEIAARNAVLNTNQKWDAKLKCLVVFTDPNVATLGLSETECRQRGISYSCATYPFDDHGKAMIHGAKFGHVKILAAPKTGKILGAAAVGPLAAELIHELIVAMSAGFTVKKLAQTPHYHPTLSEIWTYPAEELAEKIL